MSICINGMHYFIGGPSNKCQCGVHHQGMPDVAATPHKALPLDFSRLTTPIVPSAAPTDSAPSEVTKDGGGLRFNEGKPRVDLISPIAIMGTAAVLEVGSRKYAEHNWRRGMAWSKVLASLLRHTFKFMAGEDIDEETGLPHVDLMACNVMFLQEYFREHKNMDDRFKVTLDGKKNDKP